LTELKTNAIYRHPNHKRRYFYKLLNLSAHEDGIWSVSWSKRGNKIVTGSVDGMAHFQSKMIDTIKIWSGETYAYLNILSGHQLGIVSTDIASNGNGKGIGFIPVACSSSLDSQIRIWDLNQQSLIRSIDAGPVEAWSGRSHWIFIYSGFLSGWQIYSDWNTCWKHQHLAGGNGRKGSDFGNKGQFRDECCICKR
jgi:WD40 repeat protein